LRLGGGPHRRRAQRSPARLRERPRSAPRRRGSRPSRRPGRRNTIGLPASLAAAWILVVRPPPRRDRPQWVPRPPDGLRALPPFCPRRYDALPHRSQPATAAPLIRAARRIAVSCWATAGAAPGSSALTAVVRILERLPHGFGLGGKVGPGASPGERADVWAHQRRHQHVGVTDDDALEQVSGGQPRHTLAGVAGDALTAIGDEGAQHGLDVGAMWRDAGRCTGPICQIHGADVDPNGGGVVACAKHPR